MSAERRIAVFCGANRGSRSIYAEMARRVGESCARARIGVVYGGGNVGLMGELADGALASGGEVVGVIPAALMELELGHRGVTRLEVVPSMHVRKARMAELSDAFLALPGGFGTFEEFCEVITWTQLGFHQKPCGLLNVAGYYDPLIAQFDRALDEGFLAPVNRGIVLSDDEPERLIERLLSERVVRAPPWIGRTET